MEKNKLKECCQFCLKLQTSTDAKVRITDFMNENFFNITQKHVSRFFCCLINDWQIESFLSSTQLSSALTSVANLVCWALKPSSTTETLFWTTSRFLTICFMDRHPELLPMKIDWNQTTLLWNKKFWWKKRMKPSTMNRTPTTLMPNGITTMTRSNSRVFQAVVKPFPDPWRQFNQRNEHRRLKENTIRLNGARQAKENIIQRRSWTSPWSALNVASSSTSELISFITLRMSMFRTTKGFANTVEKNLKISEDWKLIF